MARKQFVEVKNLIADRKIFALKIMTNEKWRGI